MTAMASEATNPAVQESSEAPASCQVCGKQDIKLRRCQQCRCAFYCSIACQRHDWKAGHRKRCRKANPSTVAPVDAWNELSSLLASSSLEQAHQDFHVATDEVQRLQREGTPTETNNVADAVSSTKAAVIGVTSPPPVPAPIIQKQTEPLKSTLPTTAAVAPTAAPSIESDWKFYIQDMANLSCFQVFLEHKHTTLRVEDLGISMQPVGSDRTLVSFRHGAPNDDTESVLRLEFPAQLNPEPQVYAGNSNLTAVSIRLSYQGLSASDSYAQSGAILSPEKANRLACRSCQQCLTRAGEPKRAPNDRTGSNVNANTAVIQRVSMLPSGQWDNMDDYLMCYPGAATVDFGAASTLAVQGSCWQDENFAVFHAADVDGAVCVLAIAGYGEDAEESEDATTKNASIGAGKDPLLTRGGNRAWREAVGGATITCSQCNVILGWAPIELPDTFRFLQHRLTILPRGTKAAVAGSSEDTDTLGGQRVTSFVAREMIRHADTQAVFAFCVVNADRREQRLWLRLLTWDSRTAKAFAANGSFRLDWQSVAKILYEETEETALHTSKDSSTAVWTWNNDWCCPPESDGTSHGTSGSSVDSQAPLPAQSPPEGTPEGSTSLVRLYLTGNEWNALRDDLQSSSRYNSKAVVFATVLAQTGRMLDAKANNVGLAAIPIS